MALYENETYCEFNFTQILLDDNEEELFLSKFNYVIVGPLLVAVICSGFAGNVLSALVFLTSNSRPRIYYYLITLAVWDTILLLCSLFLYGLPVLFFGKFYPQGRWVAVYPLIYMLSNAAHSGSIWTIVLLSLERYFALCRPLKYLTWNSKLRAKKLLAALCLTASVYNVPRYLELTIVQCFDTSEPLSPDSNRTYPKALVVMGNGIRNDQFYRTLYKVAGGLLFFTAGPLLALLVLTWKVFVELRKNATTVRHYVTSKNRIESNQPLKQTYHIYPGAEKKRNTLATIRMSESPAVVVATAASSIKFNVTPAAPVRNGFRYPPNATCSHNAQTAPKRRKLSSRSSTGGQKAHAPTSLIARNSGAGGGSGFQANVDWMLVMVMIKFCVCHTMPTLLDICETVMGSDWWRNQSPYIDTWVNVSNFLVVVNSSCNILIYWTASAKFRRLTSRVVEKWAKCRWTGWSKMDVEEQLMMTMMTNNESSSKRYSQLSYYDTFASNNNNDVKNNHYCSCRYTLRRSYGEGSSTSLLNKNQLSHISENPSSCDHLNRDSFFVES